MKVGIMSFISWRRYRYISHSYAAETLLREFFRKSIHICAAFVPLFAKSHAVAVCALLALSIAVYSACELLRLRGIRVPLVSKITFYASRERDTGRFVLGPVTLAAGVLFSLLLFPHECASAGILVLAFGDGIASIAGKLFGRRSLPGAAGKTLEGSLACLCAAFLASFAVTRNFLHAVLLALAAAIVEALPLKDFDNLAIPLLISLLAAVLNSF